ncbi:TPA: tryptophan-rich sensory protein [Candidatus Avacholeplasma faecigallinarum]|nr:tryptophan-rich sensory protein [Candidatus Avacholeplasma faecigallinarum]
MNKKEIAKIAFYVLFPLVLGSIVGFLVKNDFSYLETLNRTIIIPPIVFPIAWTILYVTMGMWAYLYDRDFDDNKILSIYYIALLFNLLFSIVLFTLEMPLLAFIDVVVLIIMIGYLFIKTLKNEKKYGFILLPYLLWLFVALSLMIDILIHN